MLPSIEIYTGPMMSGKSQALIEAANYMKSTGLRVALLQSDKNSRDEGISSRSGSTLPCDKVNSLTAVDGTEPFDAYVVDEFQFFDNPDREVSHVKNLVRLFGKTIVLGTLDYDYRGEEWPSYAILKDIEIEGHSINIFSLTADCDEQECSNSASYTALLNDDIQVYEGSQVVIDGPNVSYSPRCGQHFAALHARQELATNTSI